MSHRALLFASLSLVACQSRARPAQRPAPAVQTPAADASTRAPRALPPAPTEADVRAFVERWAEVQSQHDFARYEQLYAQRFEGVKRSGPRTRGFNRGAWMSDRQPMFTPTQRVTVRDIAVTPSPLTTVARFVQDYTSGTYHDVGTKQLVIVRENNELRIAREEMVTSEVLPSSGGLAALTPGAEMPIVSHGGTFYAVLSAHVGADWHTGAPTMIDPGPVVVTRAAADASKLPETLRALASAAVTTYNAAGPSCAAHLGAPVVLRRVDVHFGTEQHWRGEDGDPPMAPADVAASAWGLGADGALLVAPLEQPQGACNGARWAHLDSLGAAKVFAVRPADAATARAALARFRASPAWVALQTQYRGDPHAVARGNWDSHTGAAPSVRVWQVAGQPRRFVTVGANVAVGGCAEFSGALWGAYELGAGGALTPLTGGDNPGFYEPLAASDADGDGFPDFIVPEGILRRREGTYELTDITRYPNLDCDC